jgi:hypothetical protein
MSKTLQSRPRHGLVTSSAMGRGNYLTRIATATKPKKTASVKSARRRDSDRRTPSK